MAIYAIGDLQGCFSPLQRLVEQVQFDPAMDQLWFVGDLVNRGPNSLEVLRYIRGLGPSAVTVLGNHDLFLLAVAEGITGPRRKDTIHDILNAPDREELLDWLRGQPLLHRHKEFVLVHAGLLPQWTIAQAETLAAEAQSALRGNDYQTLLRTLYQDERRQWSGDLRGTPRCAAVINALTRLRMCSVDGQMDFVFKGPPGEAPDGLIPWFDVPHRHNADATIVCGHWSAMGLLLRDDLLALDCGCVWGRQLAAIRLEDRQLFGVACEDCT